MVNGDHWRSAGTALVSVKANPSAVNSLRGRSDMGPSHSPQLKLAAAGGTVHRVEPGNLSFPQDAVAGRSSTFSSQPESLSPQPTLACPPPCGVPEVAAGPGCRHAASRSLGMPEGT